MFPRRGTPGGWGIGVAIASEAARKVAKEKHCGKKSRVISEEVRGRERGVQIDSGDNVLHRIGNARGCLPLAVRGPLHTIYSDRGMDRCMLALSANYTARDDLSGLFDARRQRALAVTSFWAIRWQHTASILDSDLGPFLSC